MVYQVLAVNDLRSDERIQATMTERMDQTARVAMAAIVKTGTEQSAERIAERAYELAAAMERHRARLVMAAQDEREAAAELEAQTAPARMGRVLGTNLTFYPKRSGRRVVDRVRNLGGF